MEESYPNSKKTLWEKEKLLVTSNIFFSHSVFKRLVSQRRQKVSLCGKGLRNGNREIVTGNFSFSHNVFHSYISLVYQNAVLCCNGLNYGSLLTQFPI